MQLYVIHIYTQVPSPSDLAFIPFWFNRSSAFTRSTPRSRSRKWCAKRLRCLDGPWWHWLSKALPKCRIWLHDTHFLFGYVWGSYSFDMLARKPFSCNDLELLGVIQSTVQDDASWNGRWSRSGPISQTNRRISQLSRGDFPDSREEIGLEEGSVINALVKNKGRRRFFFPESFWYWKTGHLLGQIWSASHWSSLFQHGM